MEFPLEFCRIIKLPKINDQRGNLTFVEENKHIPFDVKRIFYIYDIPTAQSRGAHAHRRLHQFLICLSGSLDVNLDDGHNKKTIHLNRPWEGLYVPPMVWGSETNFDAGTIYLILASDFYDESDYYRDYNEFLKEVDKK